MIKLIIVIMRLNNITLKVKSMIKYVFGLCMQNKYLKKLYFILKHKYILNFIYVK